MSEENSKRATRNMFASFVGIFGSRVTGMVRDIAMTHYWGGTGAAQAAFYTAFFLPNLFRSLFGEGAFTAAFLPSIASKLEQDDKEGAWRLAERTISIQMIFLVAIVLLVSAVSLLLYFIMGEDFFSEKYSHVPLTFKILPLLMPYAFLICATASFAAVLNALRCFALPAINPVIFNIVEILSVGGLYFTLKNDDPKALIIFCLCILLAGVLQMLSLMFACCRRGFIFHFRPVWKDEEVRQVLRKFVPGTVGAGVNQINQCIDKVMVNWVGKVAVSGIELSHRLVYLPVGLFGVAISGVCLTDMSRAASKHDEAALTESLEHALRLTIFLSVPCAVLFGVLADPFVRLLFHHGAFNDEAVRSCVYALLFYIPGIPAFCSAKVALTPHYANHDIKTPVRISIICVILNLVLNLSLVTFMKHGGLALSTSICSWINVITLLTLARKYVPSWNPRKTIVAGLRILLASLIGGAAAMAVLRILPNLFDIDTLPILWKSAIRVLIGGAAGSLCFLLVSYKSPECRSLLSIVRRRK